MVQVDLTLFVQWLNFGVLLFVLYALLYKPLIKFLDERNAKLKNDIEATEAARAEAEAASRSAQERLNQIKTEAAKHMELARKKANEDRELVLKQASEEAERILEGSRQEVKFQTDKARESLRLEMAGLVIDCTREILGREVKEDDHKKLLKSLLKGEVKAETKDA